MGIHYFGLFKIIQQIGLVAYKIQLSATVRIHPVFHVSLLKKYEDNPTEVSFPQQLNFITNEIGPILHQLSIVQNHQLFHDGRIIPQVLIHWEGLTHEDNSWEDVEQLNHHYLSFDLEDKDIFDDGDDVMIGMAPTLLGSNHMHMTRSMVNQSNEEVSNQLTNGEAGRVVAWQRSIREKKSSIHLKDFVNPL